MKSRLALCILPLLVSCSIQDKSRSSTEVVNELKVASIQGLAATGYAMQSAQWELFTPNGKRFAQGVTDTLGRITANFDTSLAQDSFPWLVRVMQGSDTLTALFSPDSSVGGKDTLFGLVNPITTLVTKQLLGPATANPIGGYSRPRLDSIDSMGQRAVHAIFGQGVRWAEFSNDRSYRPGFKNQPVGYYPSSSDMLLHTLQTDADRQNISCTKLLDSLYLHPNSPALASENYRLELATNLVVFHVPPDSAKPKIIAWDSAQGIRDSAANKHYDELWLYNASKETSAPPQVNGADPIITSMVAANGAVQLAMSTYGGAEHDTASMNYSVACKIISDLLLSVLQSAQVPDSEHFHSISDGLGSTLSTLRPAVWLLDSSATRALAGKVLTDKLLKKPNDGEKRDSVRTWVKNILVSPPVPFTSNPLRTDTLSPAAEAAVP